MCDAAIDEQVIVALPVSEEALKVIVFGAVKFALAGWPKLQVGAFMAPGGLLSAALSATVPAKPFAPVVVIRHDPDCPGAEMLIVDAHPDETLIPAPLTVTVTDCETALNA
jgi:hypothetical protein